MGDHSKKKIARVKGGTIGLLKGKRPHEMEMRKAKEEIRDPR